jgi:hypothetical protein
VPVTPEYAIPPANQRRVVAVFEPKELVEAAVTMRFWGGEKVLGEVVLTGSGGDPFALAHTLHPVVTGDVVFAEPDATGGAEVCSIMPECLIV